MRCQASQQASDRSLKLALHKFSGVMFGFARGDKRWLETLDFVS